MNDWCEFGFQVLRPKGGPVCSRFLSVGGNRKNSSVPRIKWRRPQPPFLGAILANFGGFIRLNHRLSYFSVFSSGALPFGKLRVMFFNSVPSMFISGTTASNILVSFNQSASAFGACLKCCPASWFNTANLCDEFAIKTSLDARFILRFPSSDLSRVHRFRPTNRFHEPAPHEMFRKWSLAHP